ncbi:MAG: MFS transporter [Limisphaerales bacterium]
MYGKRIKVGAFVLEGLNAVSTTLYFYFVFWFLKSEFGFGSRENLLWAVVNGVVYVGASIQGGRFGQRRGYLRALKLGFLGMAVSFLVGWCVNRAGLAPRIEIPIQAGLMMVATVAICFTWPNLEALVSEGEPGRRLQRNIGIYNLVWSGASAVAFFAGGALIERLGARTVVFLMPGAMIAGQYILAVWLERGSPAPARAAALHGALAPESERRRSRLSPRTFLRMSWLANPCAYVAIATAIPLIPTLAERLELDARTAGFFCSIWLFVRTATFVGLWRWSGWHYRFGWLAGAYLGMIAGFLFIFLASTFPGLARGQVLAVVTAAQVVFGVCIGLIYYSSLFYSMDVGDTKGDHGGIHEAAIGAGILGGPLIGGAAQWFRPGSTSVAAWAVSGVLLVGFVVLWGMARTGARAPGGARS